MVAITIDSRDLRKITKAVQHIKDGVPKVIVPAINRTLAKGATEIRREVRKVYVIKAKDIPITKKGAHKGSLGGSLTVRDTMMFLDKFFTTGGVRRRPLFARVKVGGGGVIASGFKWSLRAYRRVGKERLPIRRLYAISAPIMASQPNVGPAVNKAMGDMLDKRLAHEFIRVMTNAGGHS